MVWGRSWRRNAFADKGLCTEKTSGLWSTILTFCSGLFMCSIHRFSSSLAAQWPISMAFDSVPLLMPLASRTHLINFGEVLDHGCLAWKDSMPAVDLLLLQELKRECLIVLALLFEVHFDAYTCGCGGALFPPLLRDCALGYSLGAGGWWRPSSNSAVYACDSQILLTFMTCFLLAWCNRNRSGQTIFNVYFSKFGSQTSLLSLLICRFFPRRSLWFRSLWLWHFWVTCLFMSLRLLKTLQESFHGLDEHASVVLQCFLAYPCCSFLLRVLKCQKGVARLMMELDLAEPMMDLTHIGLQKSPSKAKPESKAD